MNRPDWNKVMAGCGGANPDDNELVSITRGTAHLAASAIRTSQEEAAYHNFNAAEVELLAVLAEPGPSTATKETDRKIPDCCDEWYCRRRPTVLTAAGDFLCAEHATHDLVTGRPLSHPNGADPK